METSPLTMEMAARPTAKSTAPAKPTATSTPTSYTGMDENNCKISMLWNWSTIDTCFISTTWHNTSAGMFAGSCIGVVCLVMALELVRRAATEYDRHLVREYAGCMGYVAGRGFRPSLREQITRAFLHTVQFAAAYIIMLLAMYYNGYIIICIFIGAFLGALFFHWEKLGVSGVPPTCATNQATICCD